MDAVTLLTIFVLAAFIGYEVISKVSTTLHTPLMSGSNAISGIVLVGTIIIAAVAESPVAVGLALLAVALASVNLVGGFLVTDRMLQLFRRRPGATE
jgi:NAD(P) transhydrogenase subunit alpha